MGKNCPERFYGEPCERPAGHEGQHLAVRMTGKQVRWSTSEDRTVTVSEPRDVPASVSRVYPVMVQVHHTDTDRSSWMLTKGEAVALRDALTAMLGDGSCHVCFGEGGYSDGGGQWVTCPACGGRGCDDTKGSQ